MRLDNHTAQYPYEKTDLIQAIAYDANDRPEYIGYAYPGTPKSAPGWQIQKRTYNVGGFVTDIQYANGSNGYEQVWDDGAGTDYASYAYS
jgi:hypothetical protein